MRLGQPFLSVVVAVTLVFGGGVSPSGTSPGQAAGVMAIGSVPVLRVQQASEPHHNPIVINVGLPRSGTTTIHMIFVMMNVSSQHIVPSMSKDNIEEFRRSFMGPMRTAFTNPEVDVRFFLSVSL